jgi:hypothetical protein
VESSLAGDQKGRLTMRVKVVLQIIAEDGTAGDTVETASFEKETERPEDLGLSIAEGRECQEFRAGLGMIRAKEHDDATPQRTSYS